jgi:hypothetical protein
MQTFGSAEKGKPDVGKRGYLRVLPDTVDAVRAVLSERPRLAVHIS